MEILDELKGVEWPFEDRPVHFIVQAGVSTKAADLDNVIKPLLDTYQGIFDDFNDNKVYGIVLTKTIVKKGEEFISITVQESK